MYLQHYEIFAPIHLFFFDLIDFYFLLDFFFFVISHTYYFSIKFLSCLDQTIKLSFFFEDELLYEAV